jgi:hypothetical protein
MEIAKLDTMSAIVIVMLSLKNAAQEFGASEPVALGFG